MPNVTVVRDDYGDEAIIEAAFQGAKAVSQYLEYKKIRHVNVYVATYIETFRRFRAIAYVEDGTLDLNQPV